MKHLSNHSVLFVLIFVLFFSSCLPQPYVQSDRITDREFVGQQLDNLISPGDELFIRISSADEEQAVVSFQDQGGRIDPTLLSHTVSDDGTIKLPYINRIQLAGLTLEQASDEIESALSQFLFIPSAYVRFINTKVTVLGEVRSPGVYVFNYKNINILQAIGYAEDITDFGNRRKVLVIREEGVTRTKTYVDLTTDDLLESEHYLIKSDDIIFVEPLKRKVFGIATVPYNLLISLVTTGIFVYSFITN
jgi:polysaccharide biosynthesis/export protein